MKSILVVEDEVAIREFVVINLKRAGYEVHEAESGEEGLKIFEQVGNFDVVILDIMLPGIDGISVCKKLRDKNGQIGIILLSAKTQEMDKVTGLMVGADDYVTKPFSPTELVARVDAIYRRVAISSLRVDNNFKDSVKSGEFVLDMKNRSLLKRNKLIDLTNVEFQIMEYFLSNPGVVLSREDILSHVWDELFREEVKIVDVNIRRLRMKIEDEPSIPKNIVTVWGLGYKWENNNF